MESKDWKKKSWVNRLFRCCWRSQSNMMLMMMVSLDLGLPLDSPSPITVLVLPRKYDQSCRNTGEKERWCWWWWLCSFSSLKVFLVMMMASKKRKALRARHWDQGIEEEKQEKVRRKKDGGKFDRSLQEKRLRCLERMTPSRSLFGPSILLLFLTRSKNSSYFLLFLLFLLPSSPAPPLSLGLLSNT